MAVSHSFTAEYTHCFEQDFEPLDIICECSYEGRTPLHIIFDCPLFQRARDKACIDNDCFCYVRTSLIRRYIGLHHFFFHIPTLKPMYDTILRFSHV